MDYLDYLITFYVDVLVVYIWMEFVNKAIVKIDAVVHRG